MIPLFSLNTCVQNNPFVCVQLFKLVLVCNRVSMLVSWSAIGFLCWDEEALLHAVCLTLAIFIYVGPPHWRELLIVSNFLYDSLFTDQCTAKQ